MSADSGILTSMLEQVDQVIKAFTFDGYTQLVNHLRKPMILALTLYVVGLGWSIIQGWIDFSISHAAKQIVKMIVIFVLATQWSVFTTFVYDVLTNAPNDFTAILIQSLQHADISIGGADVNSALQSSFDQGMQLGVETWSKGSWHALSYWLFGVLIMVVAILISAVALIELIAAKFSLAILLVLSPLFLFFFLWGSTRELFNGWLRFSLGFSFVPIFVSCVLLLMMALLHVALTGMDNAINGGHYTIKPIGMYILEGFVTAGLLGGSAIMAASLAGGISVSDKSKQALASGGRIADKASGFRTLRRKVGIKARESAQTAGSWAKDAAVNKYNQIRNRMMRES